MLAFIAPNDNQLAHAAASTYKRYLADPQHGRIPFVSLTLNRAFSAIAADGLPKHACTLHRRYTDWWLVDGELELNTAPASTGAFMADRPTTRRSAGERSATRANPA